MTEKIGVTYLPVIPEIGGVGIYHTALFYDRGDGSPPRIVEFGPENESLGIGDRIREIWNELSGKGGSMSGFRHLVGREREWRTEGFRPETNDSLRRQEILAEDDDLSTPWSIIQGTKEEVNLGRYPYLVLSRNSNTSAREALTRPGLPLPVGMEGDPGGNVHVYWPLGAGNRLTSSQSEDITVQPMSYEYTPARGGAPAPLWTGLSGASPFADVGRTMPPSDPGALPGAPSMAAGQSGWLLNPIDRGGLLPNSSLELRQPDHGGLPVPSPQAETDSEGYPTLWNGTPIPPVLRPVAAWAMRTAPEQYPASRAMPPVPSLQGPTDADGYPTLWNGVLIPPALRPLAAWAVRTAPQLSKPSGDPRQEISRG